MSDLPSDFSNQPPTISELRAHKTQNAKHWSPRDLLIDLLRDIDSGKTSPKSLVLIYDTAENRCGYRASTDSLVVTLGLIEFGKHLIITDDPP